ncbi:MAG: Tyrosine recombinase XerC [Ignavibacteriae bacterium]|nr:MAG: Tyrosine recombinase XerC [Ignavibacteriota bacterium]
MKNYIQKFLEYLEKERKYSNHTIKSYEDDLNQLYVFLSKHFSGVIDLNKIDNVTIRLFLGEFVESGLTKKSIARKLSSLKSFFRYLTKEKILVSNPALNIATPKVPKKLPTFLDENSIDKMMDLPDQSTIFGLRDKAILELLYSTGIRLQELISLNLNHINWKNSTIKVLGKGNKVRIVPFGSKAKEAMERYVSRREELYSKLTGSDAKNAFFLSNKGLRLYPKGVYNIVSYYIEKVSDIERKSPHIIRHTFATHLLNRGADLKAVKELLGHENLSTTQIYTHLTIDHLKKIYNQAHPKS